MNKMELSRSKSKHPPAKVAVEVQRIKSKVEKSDTNRRQNMGSNDPRNQRLAELNAQIGAKNRREQRMTHTDGIKNDQVRLAQAEALNSRADEYMKVHDVDYPSALKEVTRLTQNGSAEPSVAEVEEYMKVHDIGDFGVALRGVVRDGQDHARAFGSTETTTGGIGVEDENTELAEILKARGHDS